MDTSSRRAFSLDSRTVWVEQQLVRSQIFAKDNFVLGPGEYKAQVPERHVSTPKIGNYNGPADHFKSFSGNTRMKTSASSRKRTDNRQFSPDRARSRDSARNREFSTIYNDHGIRQPLDPKSGYTTTPGPYRSHDPIGRIVRVDGVLKTTHTVPFGNNRLANRNPTRKAGQDYDINYDSHHVRPTPQKITFSKSSRIEIPSMTSNSSGVNGERLAQNNSRRTIRYRPEENQQSGEQELSVFQKRVLSVALPKLKYRTPPTLTFDDSCYRNSVRSKPPQNLTPSMVKKEARVSLYDKYYTIPRQHKVADFNSKASLTIQTS